MMVPMTHVTPTARSTPMLSLARLYHRSLAFVVIFPPLRSENVGEASPIKQNNELSGAASGVAGANRHRVSHGNNNKKARQRLLRAHLYRLQFRRLHLFNHIVKSYLMSTFRQVSGMLNSG